MNKPSFVKLALVAAVAALVASAAPAKAEDHDWTGAYAGGNLGAGMSSGHIDDPDCYNCIAESFNERLLQLGVNGGYNKQFGAAVLGLGADFNLGSQNHRDTMAQDNGAARFLRVQSKITWTGALLARAGFAVQNSMMYLTAGPAVARVSGSATDRSNPTLNASFTKWQPGFKTGVGMEFMVSKNVSVQAQYSMLTIADRTEYGLTPPNSMARMTFANSQTVATVGANWHF